MELAEGNRDYGPTTEKVITLLSSMTPMVIRLKPFVVKRNVRFWPKAVIQTKSKSLFVNDRFGEKSGRSAGVSASRAEQQLLAPYGRSGVTNLGQPMIFAPLKKRRFCYPMSRSTTRAAKDTKRK